jgi:hypothetical protein
LHGAVRYPHSTCHGVPRRTTEGCRYIAEHLEELSLEDRQGIEDKSSLFDFEGFDYVHGVVLDSMHNTDEGFCKM